MSGKSFVNSSEYDSSDYSFCLFRIPKTGGRVLWQITNSCNYPCGYCIFSGQRQAIPGELSTSEVHEMLFGLKQRNFTHVKYTGGEPFIRKDFLDILRETSELGFKFDISTNASLINSSIAKQLKLLRPSMMHVSVDGHTKELHELARGKSTYEPTIRGINNLVNEGLYVRIGTVLFANNDGFIEPMINSAISLGAREIIFSYMEPVGRNNVKTVNKSSRIATDLQLELDKLTQDYSHKIAVNYSFANNSFNASVNHSRVCPGADKFLYINNFGQISPCTWVSAKYPQYIGVKNIRESTIDEMFGSQPILNYLKFVDEKVSSGFCGCPMSVQK